MTTELFDQEFQNCASQLKSYILRITTSVPDAEDITDKVRIASKAHLRRLTTPPPAAQPTAPGGRNTVSKLWVGCVPRM